MQGGIAMTLKKYTAVVMSALLLCGCDLLGTDPVKDTDSTTAAAETTADTGTKEDGSQETSAQAQTEEGVTKEGSTAEPATAEPATAEPVTEAPTTKEEHTHALTSVPFTYPTCTEPGCKGYWICTICKDMFWDEEGTTPIADIKDTITEPIGHQIMEAPYLAPTCTEMGHEKYYYCKGCSLEYWDEDGKNPVTDHGQLEIAPHHDLVEVAEVKATCTSYGVKAHLECKNCTQWFFDDSPGAPAISPDACQIHKHPNLKYEEQLDPTCDCEGWYAHWYCPDCGEFFKDAKGEFLYPYPEHAIPATGHDLVCHGFSYPSCTAYGNKEYWECTKCHTWYWTNKASYENMITEPYEITLDPYGHSIEVKQPYKAATATTDGYRPHYYCTECGEWFWDAAGTLMIPAANHYAVIIQRGNTGHTWSKVYAGSDGTIYCQCADHGEVQKLAGTTWVDTNG